MMIIAAADSLLRVQVFRCSSWARAPTALARVSSSTTAAAMRRFRSGDDPVPFHSYYAGVYCDHCLPVCVVPKPHAYILSLCVVCTHVCSALSTPAMFPRCTNASVILVHVDNSFDGCDRDAGFETIMLNCNPETVSTDYDTSSRLYFEPLTVEDVLNVIEARLH